MTVDFRKKYNKFGLMRSPYDPRDYKFKDSPLCFGRIPTDYETEKLPFIYDQGESSMCAACSYSEVRYLQESDISNFGLNEPLSPMFTYGNREDGQDYEGMYLRDVCSKGREGSVLYRELPGFADYTTAKNLVRERKEDLLNKAKPLAITSYYVCRSRSEIQRAIINTKAVIIGIPVFNCFYDVGKDGYVKYDKAKDYYSYGGHAVVLTGWEITDGKFYWRLLNSWSKDWADNGYCWLPEEYPWADDAYALVNINTEYKFDQYLKEFYPDFK